MKRQAFTLVEMLVVIVIIAIMASMLFGAMQLARESSREAATKATIAKLNNIILRQLDSYKTRRLGVKMPTGLTPAQVAEWNQPRNAAQRRLDALRDTMRMEMPDAASDITNGPVAFDWGSVPEPALHKLYAANPPTSDHDAAQCLYMIVSMGNPEAMEQFHQSEIGMVGGKPCFVDGWGRPIMWLRWAPGYSSCTDPGFVAATGIHWTGGSQVQTGVANDYQRINPDGTPKMIQVPQTDAAGNILYNPDGTPILVWVPDTAKADHDPYDTRRVNPAAFHMIPFIYSAGSDGVYDIGTNSGPFTGDPYASLSLGAPIGGGWRDNITNHAE